MKKFLFLVTAAILNGGRGCQTQFWNGTHSRTIPARFGVIWFNSFRGKDLNVILYQNIPNLHNQYKSAERKISQKNPEYMFQRRRFICESLRHTTDRRRRTSSDGKSSHGLWPGELKRVHSTRCRKWYSLPVACP